MYDEVKLASVSTRTKVVPICILQQILRWDETVVLVKFKFKFCLL